MDLTPDILLNDDIRKALVEGAPKTLKEGVNKTEADDMIKKIEEAGGKASKK